MRITPDFSMETMKARKSWADILKTQRDRGCKPRLLYPEKITITINEENKIFYDKTRFKEYVSINAALQKEIEGKPQPKEANYTHKNTNI